MAIAIEYKDRGPVRLPEPSTSVSDGKSSLPTSSAVI